MLCISCRSAVRPVSFLRRRRSEQRYHPLSTFRNAEFLQAYGVAIADGPLKGLAARAVVVIDENDNVIFSQLVDEITTEPDYEAALAVSESIS